MGAQVRRLGAAVATATLVAAGLVTGATPAQAMYQDCYTVRSNSRTITGSCWGRGAEWRLWVDCNNVPDKTSAWTWLSRERKAVTLSCPWPTTAQGAQIQFRNVN